VNVKTRAFNLFSCARCAAGRVGIAYPSSEPRGRVLTPFHDGVVKLSTFTNTHIILLSSTACLTVRSYIDLIIGVASHLPPTPRGWG